MSERRFVIKEVDDREAIFHPYEIAINESELRQRAVLMYNAQWTCADDVRIDILLHGEGERVKEWTPKQLGKHLKEHPEQEVILDRPSPTIKNREKKDSNFGHFLKACDLQPSPAPTRAEWETWAKNMPSEYVNLWQWRDAMARWFLSMPIVPRGK